MLAFFFVFILGYTDYSSLRYSSRILAFSSSRCTGQHKATGRLRHGREMSDEDGMDGKISNISLSTTVDRSIRLYLFLIFLFCFLSISFFLLSVFTKYFRIYSYCCWNFKGIGKILMKTYVILSNIARDFDCNWLAVEITNWPVN